jgi:Fe2+ or Zn2+ uptake regulation protein
LFLFWVITIKTIDDNYIDIKIYQHKKLLKSLQNRKINKKLKITDNHIFIVDTMLQNDGMTPSAKIIKELFNNGGPKIKKY